MSQNQRTMQMNEGKIGQRKANAGRRWIMGLGLTLLALRGMAAAPATHESEMVLIGKEYLAELRWITVLMVIIVALLGVIVFMIRLKDPASFSIMRMLDFSGSYSPDPETDHEYDGIRELDNPVPAWLKLILYGSIAFGIVYVLHYHVLQTGALQIEEYENEMAAAALKYKSVELPEDAIKYRDDERSLQAGAAIFAELCQACHLADGGGSVGPNLTDAYWLHGGSIKDIYATVTNGVPEKGMIPWNKQLTSQQRLEVASFIMSLQGTTPAVAKEPQGVLYDPEGQADVPAVTSDSSRLDSANIPQDTTATEQ